MNKKNRIKNTYQKVLYDFIHDVLVVCPKCGKKAVVRTGDFSMDKINTDEIKVVCPACGYNKQHQSIEGENEPGIVLGEPIDPFFKLPLWLSENFRDQVFWVYNQEHLEFLQKHINAKLRERNTSDMSNRSLGSRLPKWMTQRGNRDTLLKIIERLKIR